MKDTSLPPGVRAECCWCGDLARMKEVEDFTDKFDMKLFVPTVIMMHRQVRRTRGL
jgi:hypothetical protein